jgi:N-acetyl-anhydromuramyl-L-alanine amidase AmpD
MVTVTQRPSPNHYAGRQGQRVAYITLHVMAGGLPGTDATFAKSSSRASSHYGVGADGTVSQYVSELDGSWADGSRISNLRSISIEHAGGLAGYVNTDACVSASARLCADIARRYGWGRLAHGQNVFLHREIPPHTHPDCPDQCPNPLRWQEILTQANAILDNTSTPTDSQNGDFLMGLSQYDQELIRNAVVDINNRTDRLEKVVNAMALRLGPMPGYPFDWLPAISNNVVGLDRQVKQILNKLDKPTT